MLTQHPALRARGGNFEFFASFAAGMLDEREFFIGKAIGWVLRDVSKKRPQAVFDFLCRHIKKVSVLSLREGSKYLGTAERDELERMRSG